jgi:hypothetical protein
MAEMLQRLLELFHLRLPLRPDRIERIERRSYLNVLDLNAGHLWSSRQKVFTVVRRQRLPGFIIEHLLKKRIADAVNDATATVLRQASD